MKIHQIPQHYINWADCGGHEKFIQDYKSCTDYAQRRILIESVPLQTNQEWLTARQAHITCSTMKDYLGMDRTGKKPGVGYKKIIKRYVAEQYGWSEPESTWNEKSAIKRGLIFEKRALELFEQETGIALKTDIGFIETAVDGLKFGYSPDAYQGDIASQEFTCLAEIKSFELNRILDELEVLHSPDISEQMQGAMFITNCPRCYKILYCAELDKIFYLKYTRGMNFATRLHERNVVALDYKEHLEKLLAYSDLTDIIMEG